eukprot:6134625-Pyramimonas_sp.AAC.1
MSRRPGVEGVAVLRECHAARGLRASRCYANVTPPFNQQAVVSAGGGGGRVPRRGGAACGVAAGAAAERGGGGGDGDPPPAGHLPGGSRAAGDGRPLAPGDEVPRGGHRRAPRGLGAALAPALGAGE